MQDQALFGIQEMAKRLKDRKYINNSTVLLLGAQTGELFRSEQFFTYLRGSSHHDLTSLSRTAQFSHYFSTLTGSQFSEIEIHSLFRKFLQNEVTNADLCLAELIKHEHFDDIIYTCIDDLLESSLQQIEMKEQKDFEVFASYRNLSHETKAPIRIIKVFGDFLERNYDLKRYLNPSDDEHYSVLQRILAKDLLIVGADPVWDRHILDAIPGRGASGMIWLVSEENLSRDGYIADLLRERPSQSIIGRDGRFEYFIWALHSYLYGGVPLNYQLVHEVKNKLNDISGQLTDISHKIQPLQDSYQLIMDELMRIQEKLSILTRD